MVKSSISPIKQRDELQTDAATVNQFATWFLIVCILVTVGNIPYEATEEQLKDIFSEVGLVVSFR